MEESLITEKLAPILRKNILAVVLLGIGTVLVIYGLISSLALNNNSSSLKFEPQSTAPSSSLKAASKKIVVDVEGAVEKPGAYEIDSDSRVKDLVVLAGGLSSAADRSYFEKNINLASKLTDGQKIYIARVGENLLPTQTLGTNVSSSQATVNINTASLKDLDSLPGVGMVTAQKIVDGRPFSDISELVKKKIVTSKVFDQIKEKISIN